MEYLILKWVHILSAIILFGTGLGSAFYKFFTDRTGNLAAMRVTNRLVVLADWIFTTPTIIIQPLTGFWMLYLTGQDMMVFWVTLSVGLYLLAGACWIPVVILQIKMKNMTDQTPDGEPVPACYWTMLRAWFLLGIPAFSAMVWVVWLMISKSSGGWYELGAVEL